VDDFTVGQVKDWHSIWFAFAGTALCWELFSRSCSVTAIQMNRPRRPCSIDPIYNAHVLIGEVFLCTGPLVDRLGSPLFTLLLVWLKALIELFMSLTALL